MQYQDGPSILLFTGSTGSLITFNSATDWVMDSLDLMYNNVAFTGDLVNIDGNIHGPDSQDWTIVRCGSKAVSSPRSARSIIRMNHTVICHIDMCHFTGAIDTIRVGDPGGNYVNCLTIERSTFNFANNSYIMVGSADCENLLIRSNVFEGGNTPFAIQGQSCSCYVPVIEDNWFGDASVTTTWISAMSVGGAAGTVGTVRGNVFSDPNGGFHVELLGQAWNVTGNGFGGSGATIYKANGSGQGLVAIGNHYNATTIYNAGSPPGNLVSIGNFCGSTVAAANVIPYATIVPGNGQNPRDLVTKNFWMSNAGHFGTTGNYTFQSGDEGTVTNNSNATANGTFTIPASTTTPFALGTWFEIIQTNGGFTMTFAGAAGVTVNHPTGVGLATTGQYQKLRAWQFQTDSWIVTA